MNRLLLFGTLLLVLIVSEVRSRSAGPPLSQSTFNGICVQLMPNHPGNPQSGNGGYIITTSIPRSGSTGYGYTAGQTYTVTLSGTSQFRGFIVEAHVPGQDQMLLGQFVPQTNQQTLDCDGPGAANDATVAHSNSAGADFSTMTFMWRAPSDSDGTVDFRYSVVQMYSPSSANSIYYVRQRAAANDPSPIPTTPPPPPGQTTTAPMGTTTDSDDSTTTGSDDSTTTPSSGTGGPTAPITAPGDYRLTFRNPSNCAPSECEVFVGIGTNQGNSSYLDIYLEGQAGGWVAVGFSNTPSMELADVVACNRNPSTEVVVALDAWNVQGYGNDVDTIQDVVQFSGSYSDGRIRCSVAKKIAPSGNGQDLNLNNEYYVLYGRRMGASGMGFLIPHETGPANNPRISSATVNPLTAGGTVGVFPRLELLRFHGILMIVAWPLLALLGIFFAAWMKRALPNGEWFQVYRCR